MGGRWWCLLRLFPSTWVLSKPVVGKVRHLLFSHQLVLEVKAGVNRALINLSLASWYKGKVKLLAGLLTTPGNPQNSHESLVKCVFLEATELILRLMTLSLQCSGTTTSACFSLTSNVVFRYQPGLFSENFVGVLSLRRVLCLFPPR